MFDSGGPLSKGSKAVSCGVPIDESSGAVHYLSHGPLKHLPPELLLRISGNVSLESSKDSDDPHPRNCMPPIFGGTMRYNPRYHINGETHKMHTSMGIDHTTSPNTMRAHSYHRGGSSSTTQGPRPGMSRGSFSPTWLPPRPKHHGAVDHQADGRGGARRGPHRLQEVLPMGAIR